VGRFEPAAGWSLSSSPNAARSLVNLEKPSSPTRAFSRASRVARLTAALLERAAWVSLKAFAVLANFLSQGV